MLRPPPWLPPLVAFIALAGCGGGHDSGDSKAPVATDGNQPASAPVCPPAWRPGWQALADRIDAPVYCPSWMPDPLTAQIGGPWEAMNSVLKDRSYLIGFLWYEANVAEVHVNFRAYPGRTTIPSCNGKPCFNDSLGTKRVGDFEVETFTVNRGADTWHVLYAWRDAGSLYTVSQHVVPALGLSYGKVVANLDRIMRGLVRISPQQS